jgi:hypothetical protein
MVRPERPGVDLPADGLEAAEAVGELVHELRGAVM